VRLELLHAAMSKQYKQYLIKSPAESEIVIKKCRPDGSRLETTSHRQWRGARLLHCDWLRDIHV